MELSLVLDVLEKPLITIYFSVFFVNVSILSDAIKTDFVLRLCLLENIVDLPMFLKLPYKT
jgi:hypothetical protein